MNVHNQPFIQLDHRLNWCKPDMSGDAMNFIYSHDKLYHNIWKLPDEFINPGILEFLHENGVFLRGLKAFFFKTPPYGKSKIHVDSRSLNDKWALNWAWGSDNHIMKWYRPTSISTTFGNTSNAKTAYMEFLPGEVTCIAESIIEEFSPTVLQIGIPHRVENMSSMPRWSVSVRDIDIETNTNYDWIDIAQKLV